MELLFAATRHTVDVAAPDPAIIDITLGIIIIVAICGCCYYLGEILKVLKQIRDNGHRQTMPPFRR